MIKAFKHMESHLCMKKKKLFASLFSDQIKKLLTKAFKQTESLLKYCSLRWMTKAFKHMESHLCIKKITLSYFMCVIILKGLEKVFIIQVRLG